VYEPGIHLPLLISSPNHKTRGATNSAMVNWVDIAPTILNWAQVKAPPEMPGRSLLPILETPEPKGWDEVFASHVFHEITNYYPMRMIRTRRYKYILNIAHRQPFPFASDLWDCATWQAVVRSGDSRYGRRSVDAYINRPREELYDLESDPDEGRNLAGDPGHAKVLAELQARLKSWQQKTKDPWLHKYEYE
jgi:N-sulfoglucosamine sulfohydrolase